jgi:hypothetical protein
MIAALFKTDAMLPIAAIAAVFVICRAACNALGGCFSDACNARLVAPETRSRFGESDASR